MIETTELYGGEVICEFNPSRHSYTIVNKGRRYKVPSVTRICSVLDKSGPLMAWAINNTLDVCRGAIAPGTEYAESYLATVWEAAKRQSRAIKTDAADKGKESHRIIEENLRRHVAHELELGDVPLAGTLLRDEGIRCLEIERRIYSRRYRYSGTLDFIGESSRGLVLLDWKTGKSIYPEFRLQTAAYVHAYEEEFPDQKIEGRYLVRIAEDGSIEPHYFPRSSYRLDFKAFRGALDLFRRVQQIEKENKKSVRK
jgi:hypothetical protein